MKKRLLLFLVLIVVLFQTACADNPSQTVSNTDANKENKGNFSLALTQDDNQHPILTQSLNNKYVLGLCYDGLVLVDGEMKAECVIAESYETKDNSIVFKLKENALFADGTPITEKDVYYSYNLAKDVNSAYYSRFLYISDYYAGNGTFTVNFSEYHKANVNLCDIPIVKNGSDNTLPVGSGRYTPEISENGTVFKFNTNNLRGIKPNIKEIKIVSAQKSEDIISLFNSGSISAVFSDLLSDNVKYKGNIEIREFSSSVLTFLGFNAGFNGISSAERQMISYSISREELAKNTLSGLADGCWQPVSPNYSVVSELALGKDNYSPTNAKELINRNRIWGRNYVILYNLESSAKEKTAKAISSYLSELGFSASFLSVKYSGYKTYLDAGGYDLYIGTVKMPSNMSVTSFANITVNKNPESSIPFITKMAEYELTGNGLSEAVMSFWEQSDIIPLYFSKYALVINRKVSGDFKPNENDIFYGIETYTVSE